MVQALAQRMVEYVEMHAQQKKASTAKSTTGQENTENSKAVKEYTYKGLSYLEKVQSETMIDEKLVLEYFSMHV